MATTEVQRTLVKSPPELWAELSDQDSLARHLSEFGDIRIISTVAESAVHWEGEEATGSALIKQAGWGTKVTLRVTVATAGEEPEPEPIPPLAATYQAPEQPPAPAPAHAPALAPAPAAATASAPASPATAQSPVDPAGIQTPAAPSSTGPADRRRPAGGPRATPVA